MFLTSISYIYLFFPFCCVISWLIFQLNSSIFSYAWYTEFLIFVSGITFIIFFISGSFTFLLIFQIHFFIPDILLLFAYIYGCVFYFFKYFTEFIVWFWQFQYPKFFQVWILVCYDIVFFKDGHNKIHFSYDVAWHYPLKDKIESVFPVWSGRVYDCGRSDTVWLPRVGYKRQ